MWRQLRHADALGGFLHNVPNRLHRHAISRCPSNFVDPAEQFPSINSRCGEPIVEFGSHPIRNWNCSNVSSFADQINKGFSQMEESAVTLIDYVHKDEAAYNTAASAAIPSACCMDREMIQHGGGQSKIEFCDIYDAKPKRLIHVKHYGGSSHLSHLFSQGAVSGELFVADQAFREKLNDKLPSGYKLAHPETRPNAGDYEIVFGVISNSLKPLDIPFFSKVSLKNAKRRLVGYGYQKITLKKIQQHESQSANGAEIAEEAAAQ